MASKIGWPTGRWWSLLGLVINIIYKPTFAVALTIEIKTTLYFKIDELIFNVTPRKHPPPKKLQGGTVPPLSGKSPLKIFPGRDTWYIPPKKSKP